MKRILMVLHVIQLVAAGVALTLAIQLYRQRVVLKGRTLKLEQALMMLAVTLETGQPEPGKTASWPERDLDEVTDEFPAEPRISDFWVPYRPELEKPLTGVFEIDRRLDQLRTYYRLDPITLEPVKHPHTGEWFTEGPGTMQALLDETVSHGIGQLKRLNETRIQLQATREELVTAITDVNTRKQTLRKALQQAREQAVVLAGLRAAVEERDGQLAARDETLAGMEDQVREHQRQIAFSQERIDELEDENRRLSAQVFKPENPTAMPVQFSRGRKGSVQSSNDEWCFVILSLDSEFLAQYAQLRAASPTPLNPELLLYRPGIGDAEFVTKVRLVEVDPNQAVGIADILPEWKQKPAHAGDIVMF
ncbi:MAG: hypothetical protein A2498_11255 [Lentisphaerae bacterium RIFOXYC12_FULL_60_16]|nr:MAG: hypothetical protein A2498_11255 [Lentisphaerae bacterium RIFOXYC12_FULL_60_16]OGV72169.1 MAG: hypothetical protein A2269_03715 [Lentisphaerae bacterium RIFOXYA12_FULL_60_10]OGV81770.1 MAG: hypothetical protein A2340_15505 [Lentisphaerae bacterium RIFOXYB12_FULL_60_10]